MRLGYALPQSGSRAGPDALISIAQHAEARGYNSLWVAERLLDPVKPRAVYPGRQDGKLSDHASRVLDPIGTLLFVAACTRNVALGTSVLVLPWYNPVLLGRRLATLDVLSKGRLRIGMGTGWSPDEFEAAGVDMKRRGSITDEALDVLNALFAGGEVEHQGTHFSVPRARVALVPVQRPRPPIYMAAFKPRTMKRVAEKSDGWMPAGIPIKAMGAMFGQIKDMARAAGRDPDALEMIVRANVRVVDKPAGDDRSPFEGTFEQIAEDVRATRALGASEIIFDSQRSPHVSSVDDLRADVDAFATMV